MVPSNPSAMTPPTGQPVVGKPIAPTVGNTGRPVAVSKGQNQKVANPAARQNQSTAPRVAQGVPKPAPGPMQQVSQPTPANNTAAIWKDFFNNWPEGIPTRGIVVNQLNEQLPFKAYMVRGEVLMLERTNPDTLGSRYILVPYSEIGIVKLTDPLNQEKFDKAGFKGELCG